MLLVLVIRVLIPKIVDFSGEKYRGSRITTNTYFTIITASFQTKICTTFCTANQSTKNKLKKLIGFSD